VAAVAAALAAAPRLAALADDKGFTGAIHAARGGHVRVLELLFAAGADANACDRNAVSLLHHAVLSKKEPAVSAVLGAGGSADARDCKGNTPLDVARIVGAAGVEMALMYAAP
jgi:ankyrin repeat protein